MASKPVSARVDEELWNKVVEILGTSKPKEVITKALELVANDRDDIINFEVEEKKDKTVILTKPTETKPHPFHTGTFELYPGEYDE